AGSRCRRAAAIRAAAPAPWPRRSARWPPAARRPPATRPGAGAAAPNRSPPGRWPPRVRRRRQWSPGGNASARRRRRMAIGTPHTTLCGSTTTRAAARPRPGLSSGPMAGRGLFEHARVRRSWVDFHLGYQPAFDGLRGIGVTTFILYHCIIAFENTNQSWFLPGAYLWLELFFVQSG